MLQTGTRRRRDKLRIVALCRMGVLAAAALTWDTGLATSRGSPVTTPAMAPVARGVAAPQGVATASLMGRVNVPWETDAIALVAVIPNDVRVAPATPEPVLDQMELTFVPRLLPVTLGTVVRFRNSDPLLHNVFSASSLVSAFDLGTYPRGEERTVRFDRPGVSVVLCNVHPQMAAFVLVIETPFWVLTDDSGYYRINDLPAGPAVLRFWTETGEPVEQWIEIDEGAETEIDFTFPQRRRGGWLDSVW